MNRNLKHKREAFPIYSHSKFAVNNRHRVDLFATCVYCLVEIDKTAVLFVINFDSNQNCQSNGLDEGYNVYSVTHALRPYLKRFLGIAIT